jgi:hypothetical protein
MADVLDGAVGVWELKQTMPVGVLYVIIGGNTEITYYHHLLALYSLEML